MNLPVGRRGAVPHWPRPVSGLWHPWGEWEDLWGDMERYLRRPPEPVGERMWTPIVEEEETEEAFVVRAELPGVPRENVEVELCEHDLCITGELREEDRGRVLTRRSGRFSYRVSLPSGIDTERIEANLNDGILTVRVPKTGEAKRRKIALGNGQQ